MIEILEKLNLSQDHNKIQILFWGVFFLLVLGEVSVAVYTGDILYPLAKVIGLTIFYSFYYRSLKRFYYTYWTLSLFIMLDILFHLYDGIFVYGHFNIIYVFVLALIFQSIQMYALSSPLYYPVVSWWEYDFRFRTDLKIDIESDGKKVEGRIVDVRRMALGLQSFENYKPGEIVKVFFHEGGTEVSLKCEIVSKRNYSIGRPNIYGLRLFDSLERIEEDYKKLNTLWRSKKRLVREQKFSKDNLV
ncbi:type IV pilus assembly protein PilZ [Bacteriovorax sp. BSW11_IV]|uniref:PilZ domain-containing protein n=1 Tax=Bacteriovorax sp. BSW11_IV TaxID=1353529 RepID=UPI000389FDF6|nr:PilZ domain-containing protein [Bacteriovorax sp. BSW11_IV]EQC42920.1 type IV pilus assembly protein PilZ [Bacteriovorax sp. BSW11_IV]